MPVKLYMDVHIPRAITEQLRIKSADVITAQEDGATLLTDEQLLDRATALERVVFTHDHRFRAMAEQRIRDGRHFSGLAFGPLSASLVGRYVSDLTTIAQASNPEDWRDHVEYLPF